MQRSMPIITTKVTVIGGSLLLGLLAVAVWLLASASPASAQTNDTNAAPQSAPNDPAAAPQPASPVLPDLSAPLPVDLQLRAPELPPPPADLNALTPALPSVTDVVPAPLQPADSDVSGLLPAPVRGPIDLSLSHAAPPPSRVDVAPGGSAQ